MTVRPSVRSFPLALAALGTIGFISVLVASVTSMALGTLADAFGTSMRSIVWVTSAYLLAAGVALPVAGWGVDRFGGRTVLLGGVGVFAAGSLASGLAANVEQLFAARAIQGLGGGVLEPACLALLSQITGRRRIGTVMGLMALLINIAPIVGPVIGAGLLALGDWHAIFLFAVPPALFAGALLMVSIRHDRQPAAEPEPVRPTQRLDVIGLLLLTLGFTSLLLGLTLLAGGSRIGALAAGALGAVALAAYGWHCRHATVDPVIDIRLFTDRRLSGAAIIMGATGVVQFSMLTMAPLLAEQVWQLRGPGRAVPLCVLGAGMLMSMSVAGALSDRVGPRVPVLIGTTGTALFLFAFAACVQRAAPRTVSLTVLFLAGVAFGAVAAPTFASIYRILPPSIVGAGTTAVLIAVQISASIGTTAVGALIERLAGSAYSIAALLLAVLMLGVTIVAHRALPATTTTSAARA